MRTFKQFVGSLCFLLTFIFGLAIFASSSSIALAKDGGSIGHAAGLQFGQVWPAGSIGENVDAAISPGLFYEYQTSEVFGVKADWIRSRHSSGNNDLDIDTFSGAIKANLIYYDSLVPYAFFGMGLYVVDKSVASTNETASKTLFGMNFGFGADLDLSSSAFLGMSFTVHNLFSGNSTLPSGTSHQISGRWSGFFLRGGMRF